MSGEAAVQLLGAVGLRTRDGFADIGSERQRILLAVLALSAGDTVPIDDVISGVWRSPPVSVRQQVHNVVNGLRRTLRAVDETLEIETSGGGYRLAVEASRVDLHRFRLLCEQATREEQSGDLRAARDLLTQALAAWRGPAFGSVARQMAKIAKGAEEERLAAREQLARVRIQINDLGGLAGELYGWVAEHPAREGLRASLMRALFKEGQQADALAVFDQGRRTLANEFGLDPGDELRSVHAQILAGSLDDAEPYRSRDRMPGIPARLTGTGNFLPRDLPEFVGRHAEVEFIENTWATPGGTPLPAFAIDGMGGIGKTTLCLRVAHRLSHLASDGQFFIDLRGFSADSRPLAPLYALQSLLHDAGVRSDDLPTDTDACSSMWRALLADKRTLLILDNAASLAQVRPLLPGAAESMVLISSRNRLGLEGAVAISLDVLTHAEALRFLELTVGRDRLTAEPEAARQVVDHAGALPLAVQIVAARLQNRPSWTFSYLASQLGGAHSRHTILDGRDRSVQNALALSYHHLTDAERRCFRLLSIIPGPTFDAPVVAAATAQTVGVTATTLESLCDHNLLNQPRAGHYALHDLVRDCAGHFLEQESSLDERHEAKRRVLQHWDQVLEATFAELINGPFRRAVETSRVLSAAPPELAAPFEDDDYRNVVEAIRMAASEGFHSHAWRLACLVQPYASATLNYTGESQELYQLALESARRAKDRNGEIACLAAIGNMQRAHGHSQEALATFGEALQLSAPLHDRYVRAYLHTYIGVARRAELDFEGARLDFDIAREHAVALADIELEAAEINNLGVVAQDRGRFDEALEHFTRTIELDAKAGVSRTDTAVTVSNIAQARFFLGRIHAAARGYQEALEISRACSAKNTEIACLIGLSMTHRAAGDYRLSIALGNEAAAMARSLSMPDREAEAAAAVGDALLAAGDIDSAASLFSRAMSDATTRGSRQHLARAQEGLAHVAARRGDRAGALLLWRKALDAGQGGVYVREALTAHLTDGPDVRCWRCADASVARPTED